jgi:drug/metabolite transporter (DMT)-like permease
MATPSAPAIKVRLPTRLQTPAVLAGVWVLFGAAFIGVRVGVHGAAAVPPFLFSGSRFLAAGAILLLWSAWRAGWRLDLRRADVAAAGVVGVGLMVGGQGAASWASQYVQAGLLAVLVTTVPVWIALFSWAFLRQRPPVVALLGILTGFAGVAFLASPSGGAGLPIGPALVVLGGSISWAAAALYGSRTAISRRPLVATGIQLLAGGLVQTALGLGLGEAGHVRLAAVTGPAGLAWLFLLLGPSLIGFPLFTRLLTTTPPAVANTNAYVSPVVTLFLGWLLLSEPVGPRTLAAAAVTLASVALIVTANGRRAAQRARPQQAQPDGGAREPDREAA